MVKGHTSSVYFWERVKSGWWFGFDFHLIHYTTVNQRSALCPDELGHPIESVQQEFGGVCMELREEDLWRCEVWIMERFDGITAEASRMQEV